MYPPPSLYMGLNTAPLISNRFMSYVSPTTILIAIFTLLLFSKMKIHSRFVNWVGASCFAVYLLHGNPCNIEKFKDYFGTLHEEYSVLWYWVLTFASLAFIFVSAILIDQLRLLLWKRLWHFIEFKIKDNENSNINTAA